MTPLAGGPVCLLTGCPYRCSSVRCFAGICCDTLPVSLPMRRARGIWLHRGPIRHSLAGCAGPRRHDAPLSRT